MITTGLNPLGIWLGVRESKQMEKEKGSEMREPDKYRIKSLKQTLKRYKADKKQFESRRDQWQLAIHSVPVRSVHLAKPALTELPLPADRATNQEITNGKDGRAQIWNDLHVQFKALAEEELRKDPHNKRDKWLRAYVIRDQQNGEQCDLSKGVDEVRQHWQSSLYSTKA